MSYTNSAAFAGRRSKLQYSTNPPSVAYVELSEIKSMSFSGAKYDLDDVTNMQSSNFREWLPTLADAGDLSFSGNLIPNDVTAIALDGFFSNATRVTFQVVLPPDATNGYPTSLGTYTFTAFVSSIDRDLPLDKAATISGKLKITGEPVFTAGS